MRNINDRRISWSLFVFWLLVGSTSSVLAQSNWWNVNWNYRLPITVEPTTTEQPDRTVAATINFTIALKAARARGIFVSNTLRLVEVGAKGNVSDAAVPLQFDFAPDYHATRKAQGTLLFLVKGTTATARRFYLYFETHEARNLTQILAF